MFLKKIIINLSVFIFMSTMCFALDPVEKRLDPRLKILYRAQKQEISLSEVQAKEVVSRLSGLKWKEKQQPFLMPILVKYAGDKSRLAEYGLQVQTRVGNIFSGVLAADALTEFMKLPGIHYLQLSQRMKAYLDTASKSEARSPVKYE
ncbi:hypothetical protein ACFL27_28200, partial [candidate division CSSED10-310 bacterium]